MIPCQAFGDSAGHPAHMLPPGFHTHTSCWAAACRVLAHAQRPDIERFLNFWNIGKSYMLWHSAAGLGTAALPVECAVPAGLAFAAGELPPHRGREGGGPGRLPTRGSPIACMATP